MGAIYGSSYYTIVDGPSWTKAEANAEAIGGPLAAVSSGNENSWLAKEFSQTKYFYDGDSGDERHTHFWLGGKKDSNTWSWTNGEPWFDGWKHDWGLPNNTNTHFYLQIDHFF